ncbi:MAG: hypothetical protein CO096_28795 [Armatimonadetes bacterium CG_4_9_14_3_um_filter_66_14]|nr:MAG: hypothetical protein CO096_28795 [Armatimonadetes bacterium CG_4_9_14_3_um_filter_66_14]
MVSVAWPRSFVFTVPAVAAGAPEEPGARAVASRSSGSSPGSCRLPPCPPGTPPWRPGTRPRRRRREPRPAPAGRPRQPAHRSARPGTRAASSASPRVAS